jgi:integrase
MPKKRGNNEGCISKRKDGKWCAVVTVGFDEDGKQKRRFFYGKTRQEVADKMNEVIHNINRGTYIEPSKIKLNDWLNTWLNEYKKSSIRPSTYDSYEYLIRLHITPAIGHIVLKDLRPEHLQKLYNDKTASGKVDCNGGLSAKTVNRIHVVLHAALDQAVKNSLVIRNVSEATTLPKQKKKEIRILSVDEQMKFLSAISRERLKVAFILALGSGIREGELLALRWKNVNLKDGTIRIAESIKRVRNYDPNIDTKTKLIFQEPKTEAGKRTIPLPENVLAELKEHRKRQYEEKLRAGSLYEDNDLVFCTEIGKVLEPRNFLDTFYSLIKKAEISHINFHALRHTYATRLLEANEHPKVVQEILGHSDIRMTLNTYSHVMPDIKMAAAQKLNHLFENKNSSHKEGTM